MPNSNNKTLFKDGLILFIINIIFYYKFIFLDKFMYSTSELLSNFFPLLRYMGSCLRKGFLPAWDPYYYFDFVGVSFPGVFYPFNILVSYIGSFLSLNNAFILMQFDAVLHFFLGSLFMFIFIYKITQRKEGAYLGAIAFAYSGFVAKSLQVTPMIHTVIWLPLILLFFIKGVEEKYKFSVFSGIILSLTFLSGYLAVTFYICFILFLYAFWTFILNYIEGNFKFNNQKIFRPILATAITFLVAFGLGVLQILPTWQYGTLSVRSDASYDNLVMWGSVQPAHLITLIIPHFFGGAGVAHWGGNLVYPLSFAEAVYYAGIFALLFGIVGLYLKTNRRLRKIQHFLFFILIMSIFMMMGRYNSVFGIFYSLRIFPVSRIPARWGFFIDFSIAALGGIGLGYLCGPLQKNIKRQLLFIFDRLIKPISKWLIIAILPLAISLGMKSYWPSVRSILHFAIFYIIFVIFLFLRLKTRYKRYFSRLLLLFVFLDMFLASARISPAIPDVQPCMEPEKAFKEDPLVKFLKNDKGIYRVSGLYWPLMEGETNRIFTLGYLGGFRYSRFSDFRGESNPMGSAGGHSWFDLRPDPASQWIDFYNIKYLIAPYNLSGSYPEKYELISYFYDSSGNSTGIGLYKNKGVFPRAYYVSDYEIMPDSQEILERMRYIDLMKKAILEEDPGFTASKEDTPYAVEIINYKEQKIELEVNVDNDGILVMSDVYYPGWKAFVDGEKTKILRANYVFRAVRLTPGYHKIKFIYSPLTIKIAIIITSLAGIILLIIFINSIISRKDANK